MTEGNAREGKVFCRNALLCVLFGYLWEAVNPSSNHVYPGYNWYSICISKAEPPQRHICIQRGKRHRWSVGSTAKNMDLKITYTCSCFKKKKSNLIYNSDIAFVVQLVCSCRATVIFISFCPCRPRFPPVCHIIITWPDALIWWIVTPRLGSVWYTSSHSALFYQLLFSGHSAAENVAGLGYFFCFLGFFSPSPLSVLAVSTPQYTQSLDAVWQA